MFKPVKINFFQKSFDSKFRNFLFYWYQGNYIKFLKNRLQWYLYPNMKKVAKFPLHVDIEAAATCNLRCPMCANRLVSNDKFNSYGRMDIDFAKRIIDECAENNVFSVRLSWRGEVFSHPRFLEIVKYAKVEKKIPQVSFLTNGWLLKGERAKALIDFGVDYISVSVDGLKEIYEKIRRPLKFKDIYRNLKDFKELKIKMRKKKPVVRVTTLWPAIAKHPQKYYDLISKVCDKIVYNPLKDYSITNQDRDFTVCQFLWERLFISFDGKVHPCSNTKNAFVIGSLKNNTIKEIWHGEEMTTLRDKHKKGKRLDIFPCNECSYGVDFEKRWKDRDWIKWNPEELNQLSKGNQ